MLKISNFLQFAVKIFIFSKPKNPNILHGQVFVMKKKIVRAYDMFDEL